MSSGPPILPPVLATQSAKAAIQAVAVKLIHVPSNLENNSSPVRLRGEVTGQTDRGSVLVETERGLVELVLRDRQSLPKGMRIEIDVPAGRPPQNASIRSDNTSQTSTSQAQRSLHTLAQAPGAESHPEPPTRLDRSPHIDPRTLENVISSKSDTLIRSLEESHPATPIAKGNLEIGQYVRLTPISASSLNGLTTGPLSTTIPLNQILSGLVEFYQQANDTQNGALRSGIAMLLSQIALPTSLIGASDDASKLLIQNIRNIIQLSGFTNNSFIGHTQTGASNPTNLSGFFPPSTPLDAQILATHIFSNSATPATAGDSFLPSAHTGSPKPVLGGTFPPSPLLTGNSPSLPVHASASAIGYLPPKPAENNALPNSGQILVTIQPASSGLNNAAAGPSTNSLTTVGQLVGMTGQNLPILGLLTSDKAAPQYYIMQFQASNLFTAISSQDAPPDSSTRLFLSVQPLDMPAGSAKNPIWTSLQDILDFLRLQGANSSAAGLAGASAAQALSNMLPSPAHPANLGALATLLLSLFRGGDVESFMPSNALDLLRQSSRGKSLLDALSGDIGRANRGETAPMAGDWRGVYIPFTWDQNIHKIPLYYKEMEQNSKDEEERKRRRMRFLFDLNLSRMGDVQIDGFLQPAETSARLDLVMRTRTPLSPPMQARMKQIYSGAVEKSQLVGDLSFQFRADQWVDFGDELELSTLNA